MARPLAPCIISKSPYVFQVSKMSSDYSLYGKIRIWDYDGVHKHYKAHTGEEFDPTSEGYISWVKKTCHMIGIGYESTLDQKITTLKEIVEWFTTGDRVAAAMKRIDAMLEKWECPIVDEFSDKLDMMTNYNIPSFDHLYEYWGDWYDAHISATFVWSEHIEKLMTAENVEELTVFSKKSEKKYVWFLKEISINEYCDSSDESDSE